MGRIEKSFEIKAPAKKVWEMLAFDRSPEWMGDLTVSGEYTSEVLKMDDKFKVGASAHVSTHSGREGDVEITESLKHKKMTSRLTSRDMTSIGTYSLKPTETGTAVTYVMDYEFKSIFLKMLGKLAFSRMIENDYDKASEKLKSILEK